MQALTVWPSKCGFGTVPQLYLEVGSLSRNRRRRRWGVVESCYGGGKGGIFSVSNSLRFCYSAACLRCVKLHSGCELCCLKLFMFTGLRRGSVVVAWATEQQEIGNEVVLEAESNSSVDGLLETREMESDGYSSFGRVGDCNGNKEGGEDMDMESEGRFEVEEDARVDVRALAQSFLMADNVEEVLKDLNHLPPQVYSTLIRVFGREKRMDCAMALFKWLKRKKKETNGLIGPNLYVYNSLLGAVKQCQAFGKMERIMDDMAKDGFSPNIVTYNSLMAIYVEQGKATKALKVLDDIQEKGFTLNAVSYSQALLAYRRMEDGFGALNFFVDIREKYLKGEIGQDSDEDWENEFAKLENFVIRISYQVMRRWLVNDENLSSDVLKFLDEIDKAGLQLGRAEYERLVWACLRSEHYVVGKELYTRVRDRYGDISLSVCNHLIWLMGKAKKWWAALEIYEDMLDKGPKPNNMSTELIVSHFNILLSAARKRGIWRWGVRLLNKMEDKGLKPGSREWNAVLVACSKASEYSAAVEIFKRMVEKGEKPTVISYGALLSALEKGKLYDEALRVWQHMVNVGVKPNVYAYTIMASVFTAQGKFNMVELTFKDMAQSGVAPTVVTYNAIISACARNSMSSAAYEWFHRMRVHSISPNEITYEMLIEALAKDGKPRLAYELYLRAQKENLSLSVKAYDAVVESSELHGATIDLTLLGTRPPDKKKVVIRKNLTDFCHFADVPRRSKPFGKKEIYNQQTD